MNELHYLFAVCITTVFQNQLFDYNQFQETWVCQQIKRLVSFTRNNIKFFFPISCFRMEFVLFFFQQYFRNEYYNSYHFLLCNLPLNAPRMASMAILIALQMMFTMIFLCCAELETYKYSYVWKLFLIEFARQN